MANIPKEIVDQFYVGTRTEAVRFVVNDSVRINAGPHKGRVVAVISIVALDPEVVFLVEPGSQPYGDLQVPQAELELLA